MPALKTWPTARNDATESLWSKMVRRWFTNGVNGNTADTDELQVFADSSGMQVKVRTGDGLIEGFAFENPSLATLTVDAAAASVDRLDTVILRLDRTEPTTVTLMVLKGSNAPNGSTEPVPAPLLNTATNVDVALAYVRVNRGVSSIAAGNVQDVRTYVRPRESEPTGTLRLVANGVIPAGWLECNGQPVSRSTYLRLFQEIGTLYGAGDGSTTFNVPDFRDRFAVGRSAAKALGSTGGSETAQIHHTNLPSHSHPITDKSHAHTISDPGHAHGVNDPSHGHGINDPGHGHGVNDPGHKHSMDGDYGLRYIVTAAPSPFFLAGGGPVQVSISDIDPEGTGISIAAAGTGIGVHGSYTGVSLNPSVTNLSLSISGTNINSTEAIGGDSPMPVVPKYVGTLVLIKT